MAQPHPGPGESPPADSPPPAYQSQVGANDDAVVAVGSKMDEVVHLLGQLKESVMELRHDVAKIKAEAKDTSEKNKAGAERAAGKGSMGRKIWQDLMEHAAVLRATALTDLRVGESCFIAVALFLGVVLVGKGRKI